MESEDSRDDSSGSESNDEGPQSPNSGKSEGSRSRSGSSSSSRPISALSHRSSDSSPEGRKPGRNNIKSPGSDRSRSSSLEKSDQSRSSSPEQKGGSRSSSPDEDDIPNRSRAKERSRSSSVEDNKVRSRSSSTEELEQNNVRHISKEKQQSRSSSVEKEKMGSRSSSIEEEKIRSRSSSVEDDRVKSTSNKEEVNKVGAAVRALQRSRSSSLEEQVWDSTKGKSNHTIGSSEETSILKDEKSTKSAPLEEVEIHSRSSSEEKETNDSTSRSAQKASEHISLSPVARKTICSRSSSMENEKKLIESRSLDELKASSRSSFVEKELENRSASLEEEKKVRRSSCLEKEKVNSRPSSTDKNERLSHREEQGRSSSVDADKPEHPSNSVEIEKHISKPSNLVETEAIFDRPTPVEKKNIRITLLNNIEVARPQSPLNDSPHSPPYTDRQQIRSPDPPKSPDDSPHSSRSSSPDCVSPSQDYRTFKSGSGYRKSRGSQKSNPGTRGRGKSSSSDSSNSSIDSFSRKNKNFRKNAADTMPEAISDGDMEIDQEKDDCAKSKEKSVQSKSNNEINMSHADLSDVSDLEDSMGAHFDQEDSRGQQEKEKCGEKQNHTIDSRPRSKSPGNQEGSGIGGAKKVDSNVRQEEAEEQLDFEAEDGECPETENKEKEEAEERAAAKEAQEKRKEEEERKKKEREDLEEGEVTDEDDVRPEETEPRPVCRFFSRGQCTWGASCRFLHPGVTDKGNYTMFDLVRPMMPGEFRDERMYVGAKIEPPVVESAWERGLRTAKEMVRKSLKRKEQDMDFEEKKMNLSLAQEEFDKENGYYGRVPSPEPRYVRHVEYPPMTRPPPPDDYYAPVMPPPRRHVMYEPEYIGGGHPRAGRGPYREPPVAPPPSHRGPPQHHAPHHPPEYYAEDVRGGEQMRPDKRSAPPVPHPAMGGERSRGHAPPEAGRPKREVIVQRAEEVRGRGDEWSDPWMRLKSPAGRRNKERKRSYSSGSSYSSSSSSRSSSDSSRSSYRSRSRTPRRSRRSRSRRSRHVSPSVIVSERKAANERAALMNPPAPKRRAPSPTMMRVSAAANPPAPSRSGGSKLAMAAALARMKSRGVARLSRSSSGSSSSSSDSEDSSDSSSSSSRDASPTPPPHHAASAIRRPPGMDISLAKAMDALKGSSMEKKQIKLTLKTPMGMKGKSSGDSGDTVRKLEIAAAAAVAAQGKKRQANSPPQGESKSKKATSRREELLKQLKAVEDAIAKKRSKVN